MAEAIWTECRRRDVDWQSVKEAFECFFESEPERQDWDRLLDHEERLVLRKLWSSLEVFESRSTQLLVAEILTFLIRHDLATEPLEQNKWSIIVSISHDLLSEDSNRWIIWLTFLSAVLNKTPRSASDSLGETHLYKKLIAKLLGMLTDSSDSVCQAVTTVLAGWHAHWSIHGFLAENGDGVDMLGENLVRRINLLGCPCPSPEQLCQCLEVCSTLRHISCRVAGPGHFIKPSNVAIVLFERFEGLGCY